MSRGAVPSTLSEKNLVWAYNPLLDLSTGHLNQLAGRESTTKGIVAHQAVSSQVVDLYCDSKISEGHGAQKRAAVLRRSHPYWLVSKLLLPG